MRRVIILSILLGACASSEPPQRPLDPVPTLPTAWRDFSRTPARGPAEMRQDQARCIMTGDAERNRIMRDLMTLGVRSSAQVDEWANVAEIRRSKVVIRCMEASGWEPPGAGT